MFDKLMFLVTIFTFVVSVCLGSDYNITIPVNSTAALNCFNDTVLNIVNISVEQTTSACTNSSCYLTDYDKKIITRNCNNLPSCEISTSQLSEESRNCIEAYGHVDLSYTCRDVVKYSCDFQKDFSTYGWTAESKKDFKWERIQGGSSDYWRTGPDMDHTYANSSGYYAFVDGSECKSMDDFSNLTSGKIIPNGKQCLSFWYFMYGDDVGSLSVHKVNNESFTELWLKSGNQGNRWYNEKIQLEDMYPYSITLMATCYGKWSYEGDIAIDDILITNRDCQESGIDCNFDVDLCSWTTDTSVDYFWERYTGSTPTGSTGPSYDHTTGSDYGSYVYLEASKIPENSKASLISKIVNHYSQSCFSFWYHMYGGGIGTLNVYLNKESSSPLWSESGNKWNKWLYVALDVALNGNFQIIFEGIRGHNTRGDIAIDDIVWTSGFCNGSVYFKQTCSDLNHHIMLQGCPKHYLETDKLMLKFHSEIDGCSNVYKQVQDYTSLMCYNSDDMDICSLDINSNFKGQTECFTDNRLKVQYTCDVKPLPVVGQSHSDELSAGTVAAIVICVLVLILIAVLVIIFVFRRKHHSQTNKCESSFIGAENKSYNHVVYKSENKSKEHQNETYENVSDKSCSSADEKNTYFEFCQDANGPSDDNVSGEMIGQNNANTENPNYFVLSRDTKYSQPDVFRNQEHSARKGKGASSVANSDLYKSSAEGTYDVSNDANHKEMETNLYSHTIDNVYDTTHQRQQNPDREDTYDHFSS